MAKTNLPIVSLKNMFFKTKLIKNNKVIINETPLTSTIEDIPIPKSLTEKYEIVHDLLKNSNWKNQYAFIIGNGKVRYTDIERNGEQAKVSYIVEEDDNIKKISRNVNLNSKITMEKI